MVAQLLPEFLKVHAACAEIRISRGHRFGYFPKPTAVDPKQPFGLDERGEVFNGRLHRIVALLARHILDRGTNRFGHRL
jgi:hypothetical protein